MGALGLKSPPPKDFEPINRFSPGQKMSLIHDEVDGIYFVITEGPNRLPFFPAEIYRMKSMLKEAMPPPKPTEKQRMFDFIKRLLEGNDEDLGGRWEIGAIEHLLKEMDLGGMI
jgi:hypothetical protein